MTFVIRGIHLRSLEIVFCRVAVMLYDRIHFIRLFGGQLRRFLDVIIAYHAMPTTSVTESCFKTNALTNSRDPEDRE